ncbi:MAG: lysozyme [Betaproteobacteria bacterium]|nr:lysozyme [Betaproteobacteria bacterium]
MNEEAKLLTKDVLIKPFEGLAKLLPDGNVTSYPDPGTRGHPWTIGYGSTGPEIQPGTVWTMQQCEDALDHHINYFYAGICKLSPTFSNATPRRIAAITSWAYNCGLGNYRISTLKKRVDAGDWEGAATECLKWNKAAGRVLPGLTRRRKAEAMLMQ